MAARQRICEVYEAKDGFRWRLTAPNGNVIACGGEAYPTNALAVKAARSIYDNTKPVMLTYNVIRRGKVVDQATEALVAV